jgi:hypothetical protein
VLFGAFLFEELTSGILQEFLFFAEAEIHGASFPFADWRWPPTASREAGPKAFTKIAAGL